MCGIAGILRIHEPGAAAPALWDSIPEAWLDLLDDSIRQRGPDGAGRFRDRAIRADGATVDVAFVHRRLSIIDHACGHQPMVSLAEGGGVVMERMLALGGGRGLYELGRSDEIREVPPFPPFPPSPPSPPAASGDHAGLVCVVFNGCIYNHRELRRELEQAGHVFSTDHSDTEVLVHGWREANREDPAWDRRLLRWKWLRSLDGMFAFAAWDRSRAELCVARDRAGEKPLYLGDSGDGLVVFSSNVAGPMRVFAANGAWPERTESSWLEPWIRDGRSCNTPTPPVQVVMRRSMSWNSGPREDGSERVVSDQYEPLPKRGDAAELTVERLDAMLARAVESRLEADVPLACLLSGGVDSSLVAYYASRVRPDLVTLTVRMPAVGFDESGYAEQVAEKLGTTQRTLECAARPAEDLVRLIEGLGLPLGDSSLLPQYWVCAAAAEQAKVLLTGDGGDELFGGYDRYTVDRLRRRWKGLLRLVPTSLLPERSPRATTTRLARLVRACRHRGYLDLLAAFPEPMFSRLMGRRPQRGRWMEAYADPLAWDFDDYLPHDLLQKTDTASMAVPIELRAPLLCRELIHACLREQVASLMPGGARKGLLRAVARRHLPMEIVDRPKMGFAIPVGEWFRTDYGGMRQLLMERLGSTEPFGPASLGIELDLAYIRRLVKEHDDAGERSLFPWKGRDHSQRLYMLLVLSIWAGRMGRLTTEFTESAEGKFG